MEIIVKIQTKCSSTQALTSNLKKIHISIKNDNLLQKLGNCIENYFTQIKTS